MKFYSPFAMASTFLEELIKGTLYTSIIVAGAGMTISYIVRQWRLKNEKDFETRHKRTWEMNRLLNSQGFQQYIRRRKQLTEKLILKYPDANPVHISIIVKDALGEFNPKDYL